MSRLKCELAWVSPVIFSVFDITKRLAPAFWLKRNLYRVNKQSWKWFPEAEHQISTRKNINSS
jgi:hypothetical protein